MPTPELYIGIDVGKLSHYAAFLSLELLKRRKHYGACPTYPVSNARPDFEHLLHLIKQHAEPKNTHVLLERTGHYGVALEQYLEEQGCHLYRVQATRRLGKNKTDKADAQGLAAALYTQIGLQAPITNESERIRMVVPPIPVVRQLRGLVRHRNELVREKVRSENKLTAICDELFPELTTIYKGPNGPSALNLRERFPTPQAIVQAELADLRATRTRTRPGNKAFVRLQELARTTIGTKDIGRQTSLAIEQAQLIEELRLHIKHIEELKGHIDVLVLATREGQILCSLPSVSPVTAGVIIANIGNIHNFEKASKLRGYMGWSPKRSQTGITYDRTSLDKAGNATLKTMMYLLTTTAVRHHERWRRLYQRLLLAKGGAAKEKILGRVAGQIVGVMFTLLRNDAVLCDHYAQRGELPPPPVLYSSTHLQH